MKVWSCFIGVGRRQQATTADARETMAGQGQFRVRIEDGKNTVRLIPITRRGRFV
jgi:hypothetical protein